MATAPEKKFQDWLKSNLPWLIRRIENTVGSGDPDIWACHQGISTWIETKACVGSNVQLRKAQYAWLVKTHYHGVVNWVFNRSPKKSTWIQAWATPFLVEPGKKDHVRIISDPTIYLKSEEFSQLSLKQLMHYAKR